MIEMTNTSEECQTAFVFDLCGEMELSRSRDVGALRHFLVLGRVPKKVEKYGLFQNFLFRNGCS